MSFRALAGTAFLASLAISEDASFESALAADDACRAANGECGVELRQLRGEISSAQVIIAEQLEENKKYEVALDDESGTVCTAPKGWTTTGISCGGATKCCTSQPSYVAGIAHSAQARLSLYSICCSVNDHCKYDTIFVSCAPGRGPDDYSGVLAGLQEDGQIGEQAEEVENVGQAAAEAASEEAADDEAAHDQEAVDESEEESTEEANSEEVWVDEVEDESAQKDAVDKAEAEVTGGRCNNRHDLKVWKSGGKQWYDVAMDHCGTSCAAGFPCTRDCMKNHGYSNGCASCMAHAVECGRDHCLSQCISNHKSQACLHCNKKACRPVMKRCSGWAVGGH